MTEWFLNFCGISRNDSDLQKDSQILEQAYQNIRNNNCLVAQETIRMIESNNLEIRSLESLNQEEYQEIRSDNDPEHREDFLSNLLGCFIQPNKIFVSLSQDINEVERTIVHEVQHYFNRDHVTSPEDMFQDEMLAREAEDRYSGRYITRKYIRDLREFVTSLKINP